MLNSAQSMLRQAPWLGLFPGLAIALTVLSFDLIGNALQQRIDRACATDEPTARQMRSRDNNGHSRRSQPHPQNRRPLPGSTAC